MPVRNRALLVALLAALAIPAPAGADAEVPAKAALAPGAHAFWDGPFVGRAAVPSSELCEAAGPCWTYGIEVKPGAAGQLRVAVGWKENTNTYSLELLDPSGALAASDSPTGSWAAEVYVPSTPGTWTARVIPTDVTASSFRMRAKLERPAATPAKTRLLLPNMQANPPWGIGIVAPAAPFTGRPLDVFGFQPLSCSLDESAVNGTTNCLRFSVGPQNVGKGPLEMRMDVATATPNADGHLEGPVVQRMFRTDGSHADRVAGTFVFHETHAHFHVQDLLAYKLLRVTDPVRGKLEPVGVGRKASFCTLDLMIADFDTFKTQPPKFRGADVCFVPPESDTTLVMGVSPGWADVYTWDLPDQYVDFGAGGEGLFVVRARVDQPNTVRESNERDNVGYGYIQIVGGEVRLLERGIGTGPWDRRKQVRPLQP